MANMDKYHTALMVKKFVANCEAGKNAGAEACLINTIGNRELLESLFVVPGFRQLLETALPESQRNIGALKELRKG